MKLPVNALIAGLLLWQMTEPAAAQNMSGYDLRDVKVGMAVGDLPNTGYVGFVCKGDPKATLSGWSDWRSCPANQDGLHAIRFDYDPETSRDGTMVAGHPAVLTVLVDGTGAVSGLQIETDPKARLYLRKKAFLLGPQIKARYGPEGWTCTQARPENNEQPVGGVYVKERCTKTIPGRSLIIERSLFRRADQDAKNFVDETRAMIRKTTE